MSQAKRKRGSLGEQTSAKQAKQEDGIGASAFDELRGLVDTIQRQKKEGASAADTDKEALHCTLQLLAVKKQLRDAFSRIRTAAASTATAKQRVDEKHLHLQNLLFEKEYLWKGIRKCQQYKSKDEELDLVDEATFLANASEETKQEIGGNSHKTMLARLNWEREERERLAQRLEALASKKSKAASDNAATASSLEALPSKLDALLEAAKPLEGQFGRTDKQLLTEDSPAHYLTRPLYILFVNMAAFRECNAPEMMVEVVGDVEAAKLALSGGDEGEGSEALEEVDAGDGAEDEAKKEAAAERRAEVQRQKLMSPHELRVQATLPCADGVAIRMEFLHMPQLNIVTVKSTVSDSILPEGFNALSELFPGDTGDESPNPTNLFKMDALNMQPFVEYVAEIGRPYRWAQALAGLHALDNNGQQAKGDSVDQQRLERRSLVQVLGDITKRIDAQQTLAVQLKSLGKCKIKVASGMETMFPLKASAKLRKWKEQEGQAEDGNDRVFTAVFERDSVCLEATVTIGIGYPVQPPLFSLNFTAAPKNSIGVDNNLRAMEAEVNVHYPELTSAASPALLLVHQLRRVQMCFDLYIESEEREGQEGIGTGQLYLKAVKGRDRIKPFKWDARLNFFDHR